MTTHAIDSKIANWWGWPSIQEASALLARRIALANMKLAR